MTTTLPQLATEMVEFNVWAHERLSTLVSDEYFETPVNSSFKSIKDTLLHLWDAQVVWLQRLRGEHMVPLPSKAFTGTRAELFTGLIAHAQELSDFVKVQTPAFYDELLHYSNLQGKQFTQPKYQIITQLSHHGQLHRGQVLSIMRMLGYSGTIPQIDIIAWYRIKSGQ